MMLEAMTLEIAIACPFDRAYSFAHRPENFPRWAAGLSSDLHRQDDRWVAPTPEGDATVRFSPHNSYGILDHWVAIPGRSEVYIPIRFIENGEGTEVLFTLFRLPEMDEDAFARDAALVRKDLAALKAVLEREA